MPLFLTQFSDLVAATIAGSATKPPAVTTASEHGSDLLRRGFTIAQVVHDYGNICQAVTELASEKTQSLDVDQFKILNLCLDNAIADAVTAYSRQREQDAAGEEVERLGHLAHELRNLTSSATMAFHVLREGSVAIGGSTGSVLDRSLSGLRDLIDRSLSEVRLASGHHRRVHVLLAEFIEEIEVGASLDARARNVKLSVVTGEYGLAVKADRQLLASAVGNLLQNAFKFTKERGHVSLRARTEAGRVLIEVEDECGGLPPGRAEELFRPFDRRGTDLTGLGLGLVISRKSVLASGGEIRVENRPGKGCVFTIDLPIAA